MEDVPEKDAMDLSFVHVFNARVSGPTNKGEMQRCNLLAMSNKYGLIFIASGRSLKTIEMSELDKQIGKMKKVKATEKMLDSLEFTSSVKLHGEIIQVSTNVSEEYLAVCTAKNGFIFAEIYDIRVFAKESKLPLSPFQEAKLTSAPDDTILDFVWNPGPEFAGMFVVCSSDGSASVFEAQPADMRLVGSHRPTKQGGCSTCACWSPKGKQIAIGNDCGGVTLYVPQMTPKNVIPPWQKLREEIGDVAVVDVFWESATSYLIVYKSRASDREQPHLVHVKNQNQQLTFTLYGDVCYGCSEGGYSRYQFTIIKQWNLLLVSSATSSELCLFSKEKDTWYKLNLEERPEVCSLSGDYETHFPRGICPVYCSSFQWEIKIDGKMNAVVSLPILMMSTDGCLSVVQFVTTNPGHQPLSVKPQPITSEGALRAQNAQSSWNQVKGEVAQEKPNQTSISFGGMPSQQQNDPVNLSLFTKTSNPVGSFGLAAPPKYEGLAQTSAVDQSLKACGIQSRPVPDMMEKTLQVAMEKPSTQVARMERMDAPLASAEEGQTDPYKERIAEEVRHFNKELSDTLGRFRSFKLDKNFLGELDRLKSNTKDLLGAKGELCQQLMTLKKNVEEQKTEALELFATIERCRVTHERNGNPRYLALMRLRPLDPERRSRLSSIEAAIGYVGIELANVQAVLDSNWEEHMDAQKRERFLQPPDLHIIYETLCSNRLIISKIRHALNDLKRKVDTDPNLNCNETLSLSQMFASACITTSPSTRNNKFRSEKETQLREYFLNRKVVTVRSTAPENLDSSKIVSAVQMREIESRKKSQNQVAGPYSTPLQQTVQQQSASSASSTPFVADLEMVAPQAPVVVPATQKPPQVPMSFSSSPSVQPPPSKQFTTVPQMKLSKESLQNHGSPAREPEKSVVLPSINANFPTFSSTWSSVSLQDPTPGFAASSVSTSKEPSPSSPKVGTVLFSHPTNALPSPFGFMASKGLDLPMTVKPVPNSSSSMDDAKKPEQPIFEFPSFGLKPRAVASMASESTFRVSSLLSKPESVRQSEGEFKAEDKLKLTTQEPLKVAMPDDNSGKENDSPESDDDSEVIREADSGTNKEVKANENSENIPESGYSSSSSKPPPDNLTTLKGTGTAELSEPARPLKVSLVPSKDAEGPPASVSSKINFNIFGDAGQKKSEAPEDYEAKKTSAEPVKESEPMKEAKDSKVIASIVPPAPPITTSSLFGATTSTSTAISTLFGISSLLGNPATSISRLPTAPFNKIPTSQPSPNFSLTDAPKSPLFGGGNIAAVGFGATSSQLIFDEGAKPSPSAFGAPAVFGATSAGNSIFGTLGAQPSVSSSASAQSPFHANAPTPSIFGSASSPVAVSARSAFGAFGTPSTPVQSLFGDGASKPAAPPVVFGALPVASSTGSIFGGSPFGNGTSGGQIFGNASSSNQTSVSQPFGNSSAPPVYGTTGNKPLFGQSTPGFGQGSVFGQTSMSSESSGLFGSSGMFSGLGGKPSEERAATNVFGITSVFGSNQTTGSGIFSQPQNRSLFGSVKTEVNIQGSFTNNTGVIASSGFGGFQKPPAPAFGSSGGFGEAPVFGSPGSGSSTGTFGAPSVFGAFGASPMASSANMQGRIFGSGSGDTGGFSSFASAATPSFEGLVHGSGGGPDFGNIARQGFGSFGAGEQSSNSSGFGSSFQSKSPQFTQFRS